MPLQHRHGERNRWLGHRRQVRIHEAVVDIPRSHANQTAALPHYGCRFYLM